MHAPFCFKYVAVRKQCYYEKTSRFGLINWKLYQPTGLWADRNYVYAAERGGGLTIIDMNLAVKAQLGFYNSPIRAHGMCGNSKSEQFLSKM